MVEDTAVQTVVRVSSSTNCVLETSNASSSRRHAFVLGTACRVGRCLLARRQAGGAIQSLTHGGMLDL